MAVPIYRNNVTLAGINPEGYLFNLRENALKYNPDLTIIGFCCGNDLQVNDGLTLYNKACKRVKRKKPLSEKIMIIRTLKRLMAIPKGGTLYENLENQSINTKSDKWWQNIDNEYKIGIGDHDRYIDAETRLLLHNIPSRNHANYLRLEEIFREMKELTGNRLAVTLYPMACQIDNEIYKDIIENKDSKHIKTWMGDVERTLRQKPNDPEYNNMKKMLENLSSIDRDNVYKNIREILKELNIPTIELLEHIKQGHEEHKRVYWKGDVHFNYWGNHIAAREIRKYIKGYFEKEKENES